MLGPKKGPIVYAYDRAPSTTFFDHSKKTGIYTHLRKTNRKEAGVTTLILISFS